MDEREVAILRSGVDAWNKWRHDNADIRPNLTKADLRGLSLDGAQLYEVDLDAADLTNARLNRTSFDRASLNGTILTRASVQNATFFMATLTEANLDEVEGEGADFTLANLSHASIQRATLSLATLDDAQLFNADLRHSNLRSASLLRANLVKSNLDGADIRDCEVFGASVWGVSLVGSRQTNLRINSNEEPQITVDNLEIAQFIYLLLNNEKIRHVIDTITSKVVLILGRFTPERKAVLDAIREELRKRNYTPVLFDFEKPANRDITETVSTLAHMAKFVIADITDAKSIPQELMAIVPSLPSVPVQPLLLASQREYGMFEHFRRFPWVLEPYLYEDQDGLLAAIADKVIGPAEAKAKEQRGR